MTDLHHLAAAYAVDALDGDERREFEAHFQTCEICVSEVAGFRETAAQLAEPATTSVPPGLKDLIMAEVATTRQEPVPVAESAVNTDDAIDLANNDGSPNVIDLNKRRLWVSSPRVLALVGAALVVAGLGVGFSTLGSGSSSVEPLLAAPDAATTQLDGTGEGSIRVIWSADRDQALVIGDDLPDLDADQIYELWFVLPDDGGVSPAGLFSPEDGSVFELIDVADVQGAGWGVTVEPSGGSQTPTGAIIFSGTV